MQEVFLADAITRGRKGGLGAPLKGVQAALANTKLFALCSKRELHRVAKIAKVRTIPKGTRLMAEGDDGETMFAILFGIARVSRNNRKVATLGAGDVVGELAVLGRSKRNATVVAETDLEVAEISRRALAKMIADVPSFSQKLLESLAGRVRDLDKQSLC
jgi:CRP-like cAMP-binding protein